MKTLAIETSCDDTSIGIINFDGNIFSVDKLLAYSQVKEHNEFGGVVPEIASRLHSEKIIAVLSEIGRDKIKEVDNICVTSHPGLPGSLVVGKTVAAELGEYFDKPIIHVDHIIGHIFALFLDRDMHEIKFPMIILTASGGHNNIYHVSKPHPNPLLKGEGKETTKRQYKGVPQYVKNLAKDLRQKQTPTEEILREIVRNKQLEGLKFRRQHPFGRYIADFFCNELNLVIEIDGKIHEEQKEYDKIRDEFINSYDVSILRVSTDEINNDLEGVLKKILNTSPDLSCKERRSTSKVPLLQGEGLGGGVNRGNYEITKIGQTLDDAAGECFDKVSRMLGGPYPGGVRISQQAAKGKPNEKFKLNRIRLSNDKFEFSFSGLKSQVNHLINKQKASVTIPLNTCPRFDLDDEAPIFNEREISDIAYEFQESVVEVLGKKLARAALKYNAQSIGLSGGVSANDRLREYISEILANKQRLKNQSDVPLMKGEEGGLNFNPQLLIPTKKVYCTDNAAMIGVAGLLK